MFNWSIFVIIIRLIKCIIWIQFVFVFLHPVVYRSPEDIQSFSFKSESNLIINLKASLKLKLMRITTSINFIVAVVWA